MNVLGDSVFSEVARDAIRDCADNRVDIFAINRHASQMIDGIEEEDLDPREMHWEDWWVHA